MPMSRIRSLLSFIVVRDVCQREGSLYIYVSARRAAGARDRVRVGWKLVSSPSRSILSRLALLPHSSTTPSGQHTSHLSLGNQMFLLRAKPNIGCAFEQCQLTVFLRLQLGVQYTYSTSCVTSPQTPSTCCSLNDSPPPPCSRSPRSICVPQLVSSAHSTPNNIPQPPPPPPREGLKYDASGSVRPRKDYGNFTRHTYIYKYARVCTVYGIDTTHTIRSLTTTTVNQTQPLYHCFC